MHFFDTELADGTITAQLPNPPVTTEILQRILEMQRKGLSHKEVIQELRKETVPPGYTVHSWKAGIHAKTH